MQTHRLAHQFRRQDVALDELAGGEDGGDDADRQPVAPELEQRQPDGQRAAHEAADIGDEGDRPRDGADDQPELQPRQHQRDRIEGAQQQADADLPAHEPRQHGIDLARKLAHHRCMVARQEAVDPGDHVVPVEQQVEGHDRHHQQEHHDRHHPQGRGQQAVGQLHPARLDRLRDLGQRLAHGRGVVGQLRKAFQQEGLQALRDLGRGIDQGGQLVDQRRNDRQHQKHHDHQREDRDQRRRGRAAQPHPLQPVGDGVEEIGDGPADEEGQDHVAQEPEQHKEHRSGDAPVFRLCGQWQGHAQDPFPFCDVSPLGPPHARGSAAPAHPAPLGKGPDARLFVSGRPGAYRAAAPCRSRESRRCRP